jgi:long-chain acyl-CoA synthetase
MSHDIWATIGPRLESNKSNIAWIRRNRDSESVSFTYGQIYEGALHMAGRLRQQGISQGDVVSLMGPNGPEWGIGALAAWRVGAVLAPVHIGNSEGDILKQLDALNPKLILTHDADSKVKDVNYPLMNLEIGSELAEQESQIPNNSLSSEESLQIYTSGSTGTPKVVRLSHRNISTNFVACSKIVKIDRSDRFLSLLPLSHTFELVGGMFLPLYSGSSIVLPKVLTAQEVLAAMLEEEVSVVLAVPRLFRNIKNGMEKKFRDGSFLLRGYIALLGVLPLGLRCRLNAPLRKKLSPNLRYWVSGGSRLDPAIAQFFRKLGISLRQGYGLTETSPVICVQEAFPANFDSVGYAIQGVEVKIDEPDEFGSGEVLVKGDNVMLGYSDEELTKEVMKGEWFRTGDLGRLDASGNLSLTGRIKRLIVTEAGKNVYPEELETLLERYDGVKEAGVVEINQRPAVIFAMDNPSSCASMAKDIVKDFNTKASTHNQITRCAVVEDLPRTPLGKTALAELNRVFEENEVA